MYCTWLHQLQKCVGGNIRHQCLHYLLLEVFQKNEKKKRSVVFIGSMLSEIKFTMFSTITYYHCYTSGTHEL